jgi:hypothetical protein
MLVIRAYYQSWDGTLVINQVYLVRNVWGRSSRLQCRAGVLAPCAVLWLAILYGRKALFSAYCVCEGWHPIYRKHLSLTPLQDNETNTTNNDSNRHQSTPSPPTDSSSNNQHHHHQQRQHQTTGTITIYPYRQEPGALLPSTPQQPEAILPSTATTSTTSNNTSNTNHLNHR